MSCKNTENFEFRMFYSELPVWISIYSIIEIAEYYE
jgi:hypothetical protein